MIDLSIIIVSWNTRALLDACLRSIQVSDGDPRLEVVVVDNGSTDGSAQLVRATYPHVRVIENSENRGFAAANNQAMRVAHGRYVLLLNSDTEILGNVLEQSVKYMDMHPDVGAMGCRVLNPDGTLQRTCFMFPSLLNLILLTLGVENLRWPRAFGRRQMLNWNRDTERDVEVVTGCYLLVRREVVEHVGMLDEAFFFYGEETDWCVSIRDAGWKVRFAPVGEIIHHGGSSAQMLNARRDVLLTDALVHLHRKHGTFSRAVLVRVLLLSFAASRAAGWSLLSLCRPTQYVLERRKHFNAVIRLLFARALDPETVA